jgi:hypothetical protein
MPRFQQLTGDFEITTGSDADPVTWHFERTPEVEREFTLSRGHDPVVSPGVLLPVMLSALVGWEGVLDVAGEPVECSEDAFYEYIPSPLRLELLSRWAQRMRGPESGTGVLAGEPDGGTGPLAQEDAPGLGSRIPGPAPSRQPETPDPQPETPSPQSHARAAHATPTAGGTGVLAGDDVPDLGSRVPGPAPSREPETRNPKPGTPSPPPHERAAHATPPGRGTGVLAGDDVPDLGSRAPGPAPSRQLETRNPEPGTPSPPPPERAAQAAPPFGGTRGLGREDVQRSGFGVPGSTAPDTAPRTPNPEPPSLLDNPDLDTNWDFEDAVEAVIRRKQLAEQHEPLY